MSIANRLLTYDDLLRMPDDGRRYELIGGELFVTPAPGARHQDLGSMLHLLLGNWVVPRRLGKVFGAPFDVKLSERDVVQPDLLFVRQDRLGIITKQGMEGAPDLVVQILSPSTRSTDQGSKADLYAEAGIPEYWIADPIAETFAILVLRNGRYAPVPPEGGKLRSVVLPGLVVDVAALFHDLVP